MAKSKYKEEDPKRPTPVRRDGAYVMMLFISLVAMIGGIVFLHLDQEEYGNQQVPSAAKVDVKPLGSPAGLPDNNPPNTGPKPPDGGPKPPDGMPPMGMMPMGPPPAP